MLASVGRKGTAAPPAQLGRNGFHWQKTLSSPSSAPAQTQLQWEQALLWQQHSRTVGTAVAVLLGNWDNTVIPKIPHGKRLGVNGKPSVNQVCPDSQKSQLCPVVNQAQHHQLVEDVTVPSALLQPLLKSVLWSKNIKYLQEEQWNRRSWSLSDDQWQDVRKWDGIASGEVQTGH